MSRPYQYCHNHPEVKTRTKCFHCGKYICSDCEIKFLGRGFCSSLCLLKALTTSFVRIFTGSEKTYFRRWQTYAALSAAAVFVIFILGVSIVSAIRLSREIKTAHIQQSSQQNLIKYSEEQGWIDADLEHFKDAMVEQNTIDISGTAADSIILSLQVNGQMQRVILPDNGKFSFNDIKLEYGANTIKVFALDTQGHVKILETITLEYGKPSLDYLARNVTRGPLDRKQLALTFDGGAGNGAVDDILKTLSDKNIKCTMFLTGQFLKKYPKDVNKMIKNGHEIGNHTWSHPHLTTFAENGKHQTNSSIKRHTLQDELLKTEQRFKQITKQDMIKYWRAPYGEHNPEIRRWAAELGYTQIGWTISRGKTMDALDWVADTSASIYYTSDEVMDRLLEFENQEQGAKGGIILMHLDTRRKQDAVHHILPAYIDSMRVRGYTFTTISELLSDHSLSARR